MEFFSREFRLGDVLWANDWLSLLWSEGRLGRRTLTAGSFDARWRRDLTREISLGAEVGYGGGDFTVRGPQAYFVAGPVLYRTSLWGGTPESVYRGQHPIASPAVSPDGKWILLIEAGEPFDRLKIVSSTGSSSAVLVEDSHFLMQPVWHPSGSRIAWISWDHPHMPWLSNRLRIADLAYASHPSISFEKALSPLPAGPFFQPAFSPGGKFLSVICEDKEWSNLALFRNSDLSLYARLDDAAEHGVAAWIQGLRTHAWIGDDQAVYFLRQSSGRTSLARAFPEQPGWSEVGGEIERYTSLRQISSDPKSGTLALIASSEDAPEEVVVLSGERTVKVVHRSNPVPPPSQRSDATSHVRWNHDRVERFGIFTRPRDVSAADQDSFTVPTIIKVHGGPTSAAIRGFNLENRFFAGLGFAVLDLNYRGSTGYGKTYRQALDGAWGVADVEDVYSAARWLVEERSADPRRLILSGGSAGGFTVLLALARYPGLFRACLCRYPVTDLPALAQETHKFERHYTDSLIGPPGECDTLYRERSPLSQAGAIRDPVALFQGELDRVVPRTQTDRLAAVLSANRTPLEYHLFPGEGHGWRRPETFRNYYRIVTDFLARFAPTGGPQA